MSAPRARHPYIDSRFERQLEMARPSRERVAPATVPRGYSLRAFADADAAAYDELFALAWADMGTLPYTRAHALPGGFLVVEHAESRQLVASCVAFSPGTGDARHAANGSLGWLVADPAHGGRGLGALAAATVTARLVDEGYARPWLGTEDDRLVAIAIYLRLGWQPLLYAEEMEQRWRDIFARLGRRFSLAECARG